MTSRMRIYRVRLVSGEIDKARGSRIQKVEAGTARGAVNRVSKAGYMMGWNEIGDEQRKIEPHPWADAQVTSPDGKVQWFRLTEYG